VKVLLEREQKVIKVASKCESVDREQNKWDAQKGRVMKVLIRGTNKDNYAQMCRLY
jgi:hypothetical protein